MKKVSPKSYTLRFAAANVDTWNYIKTGKKKVETRAATVKYLPIKAGDTLVMSCKGKKFKKVVKKVTHFKTLIALYKTYKPSVINPSVKTAQELNAKYDSFPGYKEKLKKFGILAFLLDK